MIQGNRGADQNFCWYHLLYQRCTKEDVRGDQLVIARIKYDSASVNWCKYSKPWDVIFDHAGWGIVQHMVGNLPQGLPKETPVGTRQKDMPKNQSYRTVHVPLTNNYAHSELQAFHDDGTRPARVGELIKKEYRALIAQHGVIILIPSV